MCILGLAAQVAVTLTIAGGGPVRFGVPVPEAALARGLAARGPRGLTLQWWPLQPAADPVTGRRWVEVALGGEAMRGEGTRRVELRVGGVAPAEAGAVFVRSQHTREVDGVAIEWTEWRYDDGSVDRRLRRRVEAGVLAVGEEAWGIGEACTEESPGLRGRTLRVQVAASEWRRLGVLPRGGDTARATCSQLAAVATQLVPLPGLRGRGDYARSGGVVTNLEYDTTLGLVRLGLACERTDLLARAADSARHLVDIDLDARSGLPFAHGPDHRANPPEQGHAWVGGLLLTGCVFADADLLAAAASIARSLARRPRPPPATRRADRARDLCWPLLALEEQLRFASDPTLARAADALVAELLARVDPAAGVIRFGEGERRYSYEERHWLTGGMLLPALRASLLRTRNPRVTEVVRALEDRIHAAVLRGREGLPVRGYVGAHGEAGDELRLSGVPEGYFVLEGLADSALPRALARRQVQLALEGAVRPDDPDVATAFSIAARCTWVLR